MIKQVKLPLGRTIRVIEVRQGTELVSPIRIININKTVLRNTFFIQQFFNITTIVKTSFSSFLVVTFALLLGSPWLRVLQSHRQPSVTVLIESC